MGSLYNFLSSDTFINMALVIIVFLPLFLFFYFSAFWSVRIDASFQYDWLFPCCFSIFLACYPLYSKFAAICSIVCLLTILAFSTQFLLVLRLGKRRTFRTSAPYICMALCLFIWSFLPLCLLDITTVCISDLQRLSSRSLYFLMFINVPWLWLLTAFFMKLSFWDIKLSLFSIYYRHSRDDCCASALRVFK